MFEKNMTDENMKTAAADREQNGWDPIHIGLGALMIVIGLLVGIVTSHPQPKNTPDSNPGVLAVGKISAPVTLQDLKDVSKEYDQPIVWIPSASARSEQTRYTRLIDKYGKNVFRIVYLNELAVKDFEKGYENAGSVAVSSGQVTAAQFGKLDKGLPRNAVTMTTDNGAFKLVLPPRKVKKATVFYFLNKRDNIVGQVTYPFEVSRSQLVSDAKSLTIL